MEESPSQQNISNAKELFRRLAHFVTPPLVRGEKLPEIILENIIEQILFISDSPLTIEEIKSGIEEKLKLNFELYEIDRSIENLINKNNLIEMPKGDQCSLGVNRISQLKTLVEEKEGAHQRILEKFKQNLIKSYPNLTQNIIELITEDFQTFLAIFFLGSGAEAVNLIYGAKQDKFQLLDLIRKKDIFTLLPLRSKEIKEIERNVFIDFLLSLSSEEREYFQDLLDKTLEYFTINLDKKCEALMISSFKGWQMFIDTNFIYNLLGLHSEFPEKVKKAAEQVLILGSRFKIKFFVSPKTIDEFKASIEKAKNFLKEEISQSLSKLAEEVAGANAIASSYFRERKKRKLTPHDFLSQLEHFVDILKSYGVKENRDYYNVIKNSGELRETSDKMEELTGKSPDIAEHDSFHFLLILKLRDRENAGDSFKSNKSWFLTYDRLLPEFDYQMRGEKKILFAIHPYQLRRIMRPLISRADDFETVFIEFVSRPISRAFSAVPLDMAGKILARISYYEERFGITNSYEIASNIIADSHLIKELDDLSVTGSSQAIIQLINKEVEKRIPVEEKISKEYERLSRENLILKWGIASLIGAIQIILNIFYSQSVINFFCEYFNRGQVLITYFLINIVIFLVILSIPLGKKKILKNLDFVKSIYNKVKEIVGFTK